MNPIQSDAAATDQQADLQADASAIATPGQDDPATHTLDTPLVRGTQTITSITLRKPKSGELRGVSLSDLVSLDVVALSKVLPRISSPMLTEADVASIDPADLVQLGGIFAGFLMPKAVKSRLASQTA
ncbi:MULTISPECIES: phage tail assembly protein [Burkholderia cepacia complex]|uniref:phage tail assembly protein n=1 Tax=Burkholderia cepacia complex TaxID=87882 RepID=UPI000841D452|nr:phage tail assembly protein [Burkholderia cenocepacia]AOJ20401.1 phage tail protein [Burkholderia cenocepacia]MBR8073932.1 phage tail assembly protein [Burkholderia cenocepacia]MBR8322240.1 phage tail assembly protein [Burkholderia cenocepacia]MBR8448677.1 phage tail assembly protein [Burkholderia cenocepacia]CAD9217811.1 Putative phage tail protein [Burkholderia cenocepacia]